MTSVLAASNVECPYVQRAFESATDNIQMMTIERFIEKSGFPIDDFMVGNFFKNLDKKLPIYITNELIEWCGFGAKEFKFKKQAFDRILSKRFVLGTDYWIYQNNDYKKFYSTICSIIEDKKPKLQPSNLEPDIGTTTTSTTISIKQAYYPHPSEFDGKNKTNHLILTTTCFKRLMMCIDTAKSNDIQMYYIALEDLIRAYSQYQTYFERHRNELLELRNDKLTKDIAELKNLLIDQNTTMANQSAMIEGMREEQAVQTETIDEVVQKLDRATDERAPRPASTAEHGQFVLIRLNERMNPFKFYVIRGKRPYATTSKNQILAKHKSATIVLEYTFQANAMNLFVLIKEELGTKGRGVIGTLNNYIKLVAPYTEDMFIADVRRIEDSKKEI